MIAFNILDNVKDVLTRETMLANSVAGIFVYGAPEKMMSPFVTMELVNFRRNISKNCVAEVKLSLHNSHMVKNIAQVIGDVERALGNKEYALAAARGYFFVKDIVKRINDKQIVFAMSLSVKLQ